MVEELRSAIIAPLGLTSSQIQPISESFGIQACNCNSEDGTDVGLHGWPRVGSPIHFILFQMQLERTCYSLISRHPDQMVTLDSL
jgi:hypothetical protein